MDNNAELKPHYLEIAVGSVANRNHIIHYSELQEIVEANPEQEVYRSYYFYDQERVEHEGKAKDFLGKRYAKDLHLDYDGPDALDNVRKALQKLKGLGMDMDLVQVWFSGNKGFHIWLPDPFGFTPSALVHEEVRQTVLDFFPGVDTHPLGVNGLIRANGSYHEKAKLYKTFFSQETIFKEEMGHFRLNSLNQSTFPHIWYPLEIEPVLEEFKIENLDRTISPVKKRGQKSTNYFGCMTRLWNRGPILGRRHADLLRMITYWRHIGLNYDQALELGDVWTRDTAFGKHKVAKMVNWAYESAAFHHSCTTDTVMLEYCIGEQCPLYKHRERQARPQSMEDAMASYREMVTTDQGGFNLNEIYPGVNYSVRDGEIALLLADTKIGKSTLFLNWAIDVNRLRWLIITPEMKVEDMVERSLQIKFNLRINDDEGINEVKEIAVNGNGQFDAMLNGLRHIDWITSPPTLDDMDRLIAMHQPDVVILDPLEMVRLKDGEKDNVLADGVRRLANVHRVPLLIVHHINKDGQREGDGKIKAWMAKGFKRIQEQSDHIWSLEGNHDSNYRRLSRIMGRRSQDLNIVLTGNKETLQFRRQSV